MELARLLGFAGDGITFVSGVLLSWDAMRAETEFVEATKIVEGMKNPVMKNVTVKLDKMVVVNDQGVERVFRRRASRKAIVGTIMLSAGFLFLLASRILEPTHIGLCAHGYHIEFTKDK